ncbi:hypothetical protein EW146_g8727 [Bondarzewia mesenterica]|uniref:Fcf2 pre-rRNA processing C-terminal domain-containing protein n=1 Tax=Bondarzewia mesenterica TaxID=1095465 RepID=A0A4S4LC01_9AGAM|nr:hypothetical protein EW146_g8727 [Bondarzewia mesenterica]
MPLTTLDKGKGKALPEPSHVLHASQFSSSTSSESDSDSDSDSSVSDSDDEVTQEYLDSLLEKARQSIVASARSEEDAVEKKRGDEEEIIDLEPHQENQEKLPPLDPGTLPNPYIILGPTRHDGPSTVRDLDAENTEQSTSSLVAPAPPAPPNQLTKKEKKALKANTAGKDWFDLPAPAEADLPRLHREVEALRLRNQLDPKRFYRKDEGEGKGVKGLPKYFAIGTIVSTSTPFGKGSGDNLTRAERKRTLVDELVDDAEAKRYAKKKFIELQSVRGAKGRGTLAAKKAARKAKCAREMATATGSDSFELYDLRVEVICPPGETIMCGAKPGDHFTIEGEMLRLPQGQGFSIYSLGAVLPLLAAKQRVEITDCEDWDQDFQAWGDNGRATTRKVGMNTGTPGASTT